MCFLVMILKPAHDLTVRSDVSSNESTPTLGFFVVSCIIENVKQICRFDCWWPFSLSNVVHREELVGWFNESFLFCLLDNWWALLYCARTLLDGWTIILLTLCAVPAPLSDSFSLPILSNANTVRTDWWTFEGRGTSSISTAAILSMQRVVSISSKTEYEHPWPRRFNILITSTLPVSVLITQGNKRCFDVFTAPKLTAVIISCAIDHDSLLFLVELSTLPPSKTCRKVCSDSGTLT